MTGERVLVTGGSGLLGRFVVSELLTRGYEVSVMDLKAPRHDVAFHAGNILSLEAVRAAMIGNSAVVHLAGIDDGNDFPDKDYFETNVQGAWNVLHAAEREGVQQVVVASSTATLGLGYDRAPDYLPIDEAHPLRPTETYGLTKQVIETVCESFVRRDSLRIVALRPTLVVRPERERAILAQLALPDPDKDVSRREGDDNDSAPYGALSATRTYVRSVDCARCFALALRYTEARYDSFIVAAKDTIGRVDTLARYAQLFGSTPSVRRQDFYDHEPMASTLDSNKAQALLGWRAEGDWRDVESAHQMTES